MGFFTSVYHSTVSFGARVAINRKIARYGHMPQLNLNLSDRHVEGDILLKGETTPIHFSADYAFQTTAAPSPDPAAPQPPFVTLTNIQVSREWMQHLAEDFIASKPLPIPPDAAKMLRLTGLL